MKIEFHPELKKVCELWDMMSTQERTMFISMVESIAKTVKENRSHENESEETGKTS